MRTVNVSGSTVISGVASLFGMSAFDTPRGDRTGTNRRRTSTRFSRNISISPQPRPEDHGVVGGELAGGGGGKEFLGFPIPAAAGLVASLTFFMMWFEESDRDISRGPWRFLLPGLLMFLSFMMVSEVKYPSFKTLDLRARRTFTKMVMTILFIGCLFILHDYILPFALPAIFTIYLLYGFVRPQISRKIRHEIEEEEDEDDANSLTP